MNTLRHFIWILGWVPRRLLLSWTSLLLLASLTDGFGIFLLVPLLAIMTGDEATSGIAARIVEVLDTFSIPASVPSLLFIFVLLIALRSFIQFRRDRVSLILRNQLVDRLRETCIEQIFRANWRWITSERRTDHMHVVTSEVSRIGSGMVTMVTLLTGLTTLVAYFGAALILSPGSALLFALAGLVGFLAMSGIRANAATFGQQQLGAARQLTGMVQQSFVGMKLAKILGDEERQISQLSATIARLREAQVCFGIQSSAMQGVQQAIGATILAIYVYIGFVHLDLGLPYLLTLTLLFSRLLPLALNLNRNLHSWLNTAPSVHSVRTFIAESAVQAEANNEAAGAPLNLESQVTLRDVCVHYAGRDTPALDHVTLSFSANTTTIISGPSGAGKSTLADVLMGLITPDQGQLIIDGEPISEANVQAWRRAIAYVPQEVILFHDTIRTNLKMAAPSATDAQLYEALDKASAGFVRNLPEGLETIVGDNGLRLSGGERQRLALARGLLQSPAILILDEATSALDPKNQTEIASVLKGLKPDLTIVILGHNLHAFDFADQIVTLEAGRIKTATDGLPRRKPPAQLRHPQTPSKTSS